VNIRRRAAAAAVAAGTIALAACGGSSTKASQPPPPTPPPASTPTTPSTPSTTSTKPTPPPPPAALQAEATATAAGDVPDNQVYVVYSNPSPAYTMKYPEGWAQSGSGGSITFRDKNNIVRVVIHAGPAPTIAEVQRQVAGLSGARVTGAPAPITISGTPAIKVVYSTESAPNSVTGKRVTLNVDRYYLSHRGKQAVVDLGSPVGVDNVDAYRLMIESFRWR
jgi:hypothetical protein